MKEIILIIIVITLICCISFCEEPTKYPYKEQPKVEQKEKKALPKWKTFF